MSEFRISNADVTLREDVTEDDLIDVIEGNRYCKQNFVETGKVKADIIY